MKHTIKAITSASHVLSSQAITETPPAVASPTAGNFALSPVPKKEQEPTPLVKPSPAPT